MSNQFVERKCPSCCIHTAGLESMCIVWVFHSGYSACYSVLLDSEVYGTTVLLTASMVNNLLSSDKLSLLQHNLNVCLPQFTPLLAKCDCN